MGLDELQRAREEESRRGLGVRRTFARRLIAPTSGSPMTTAGGADEQGTQVLPSWGETSTWTGGIPSDDAIAAIRDCATPVPSGCAWRATKVECRAASSASPARRRRRAGSR